MKMRWFAAAALVLLAPLTAVAADAPPAQMSADQQAMMQKMMKAATPGPQHAMFAKMAGDWTCKVTTLMDPAAPPVQTEASATITSLMDGRYCQEISTGQMMGAPFNGMGITGYDNVIGKYVSIWIDNMGTGIMRSEGTVDASGKVITWSSVMSDPVSGKPMKARMVSTVVDDNHHTMEMWGVPPGGKKEMKTMTLEYTRK
jgi:hypothetical protein